VVTRTKWTWLAVALTALFLAVGAAACGGGGDGGGGGGEQMKVGLVTDTGGIDDRGFNQFSIAGLKRAEKDFDLETRVYVSNSADDYKPNLEAAGDDGNEFVVSVGFLLGPSTAEVSQDFPDIEFAGVDQFFGGEGCAKAKTCEQPNVTGMVYPTEESGYEAGVVAALMTKSGTVSTVGGKKLPSVDNWIAGFQQGAKDTKPGIKTLNAYSQDFEDLAKCKEIALDQVSRGSDVVFQVAGKCGLGALDAACEKGKIAIGVDVDQSSQGDCVVTSALKPLESSIYEIIKAFTEGNVQGGKNNFYGVEQLPDAKLLTEFHGNVPQSVKDAVAKADKDIKSGKIDPPATLDKVK
jgi:basic membrane protein A